MPLPLGTTPENLRAWVRAHCAESVLVVPTTLYRAVVQVFEEAGEHPPANFCEAVQIPLAKRRR